MSGLAYYYIVRSVLVNPGEGGLEVEDTNTTVVSAVAIAPPTSVFFDNMDATTNWSVIAGATDNGTEAWSVTTQPGRADVYFVSGTVTGPVDTQLTLNDPVLVNGGEMRFIHQYDIERGWDGGVLEYSTDGGANWFDILDGDGATIPANGARFTQNGYDLIAINAMANGNPLATRNAFTEDTGGWRTTIVDLSDFVSVETLFRFRFGADDFLSEDEGWYIAEVDIRRQTGCVSLDLSMWPEVSILELLEILENFQ